MTKCVCNDIGTNGYRECSSEPHRHKMRLSSTNRGPIMTLCDNHVGGYLAVGWVGVTQLVCSHCCTNEPLPGESICEHCAEQDAPPPRNEAERLKHEERGKCINHMTVHGCLVWRNVGSTMCTYCNNYFRETSERFVGATASRGIPSRTVGPKIRSIPTATRRCALTPGCAGTMTASVRRFVPTQPPELWWVCGVCNNRKVAERTRAIKDPRTVAVIKEADEQKAIEEALRGASDAHVTDTVGQIRNMLAED